MLKGKKDAELGKGRASATLLKIVKIVRQHETKKIMPREMKEILDYVGIHVSDAESVRLFEWRARKKRQL